MNREAMFSRSPLTLSQSCANSRRELFCYYVTLPGASGAAGTLIRVAAKRE